MNDICVDHDDGRRWMVCEAERRWIGALRRFAVELMPPPLYPLIEPTEPDQVAVRTAGQASLVLYEAVPGSLPTLCQWLVDTAALEPYLLRIVAARDLIDQQRIILSEFGCNMTVRHPEELPSLGTMIRGHFARSLQKLD